MSNDDDNQPEYDENGDCLHANCSDTGLHTYECLDCGEQMYYSQAAKDYYVEGKTSNVRGLTE